MQFLGLEETCCKRKNRTFLRLLVYTMRVRYALTSLLFALSCAEQIGARQALHARPEQRDVSTSTQDEHKSTATSHGDATSTGSSSSTEPASKTTDSGNAQTDAPAESAITTTGGGGGFPTATTSGMPNSGNSTAGHNALPIQPEINPALGIAGVILMIAGLGLGFVGIKHRQTQTFLSTSLLMALGIEVLIVYLMHPPVPVAVQGAFLIAGVAGGCGLGALALIFKEVSEGFGCFLGGFCFAMWLLVLAPGGLIENSAGKIILIAIFSVACFCLYISRFTRVYGLIFCTSFAGSTAFILGIDCFSKAGLKEFWLYIWSGSQHAFESEHALTSSRSEQQRISSLHRYVPHHSKHACRDCRHSDCGLPGHHVASQDLEDRP